METTNNSLADVIRWIKDNYVVCIYSTHRSRTYTSSDSNSDIKGVVFVNVADCLLEDGEWNWYIEKEGCKVYPLSAKELAKTMPDKVTNYILAYGT